MPDKPWMITSGPTEPPPDQFWYILDDEAGALAEFANKSEEAATDLYLWQLHSKSEVAVSVTIEQEGD